MNIYIIGMKLYDIQVILRIFCDKGPTNILQGLLEDKDLL